MTSLYSISPAFRAVLQFFSFIICCIDAGCIIYNFLQKRIRPLLVSLCSFAPCFIIIQLQCEIMSPVKSPSAMNAFAAKCLGISYIWYLAAMLAAAAVTALVMADSISFSRSNISSSSIKLCADSMPCGICYWYDGGLMAFSNICMNRLCLELTKRPLLNGDEFFAALPGDIWQSGPEVWSFKHRIVDFESVVLHELMAFNVSELYQKTQELKDDNEKLSEMNEELKRYNEGIDDMVRNREILKAKQDIHDEMNRLLLLGMAVSADDVKKMNDIFSFWQRNSTLMFREAAFSGSVSSESGLDRIANALGIKIIWKNSLPPKLDASQNEIFFKAAQEAMANAIKHASAEKIEISVNQTDDMVFFNFSNEYQMTVHDTNACKALADTAEIKFNGGLANLRQIAGSCGGHLSAEYDSGRFVLTLNLPNGRFHRDCR